MHHPAGFLIKSYLLLINFLWRTGILQVFWQEQMVLMVEITDSSRRLVNLNHQTIWCHGEIILSITQFYFLILARHTHIRTITGKLTLWLESNSHHIRLDKLHQQLAISLLPFQAIEYGMNLSCTHIPCRSNHAERHETYNGYNFTK